MQSNYTLESHQEKASNEIVDNLSDKSGWILKGEVGAGKTLTSLSVPVKMGYTRVVYVTLASLPTPVEYYPDMNIIRLSYSKFRHGKNSSQSKLKAARKLISDYDIKEGDFFIWDECDAIRKMDSQRTQVALAIRWLMKDSKMLFMTGTIRPTCNSNIIPYLGSCTGLHARCDSLKQFYDSLEGIINQYAPKQYTPWISRHAYHRLSVNSKELREKLSKYETTLEKVRDNTELGVTEEISWSYLTNDTKSYIKRLKNARNKTIKVNRRECVEYSLNNVLRICDGHLQVKDLYTNKLRYVDQEKCPKFDSFYGLLGKTAGKKVVLTRYRNSSKYIKDKLDGLGRHCVYYDAELKESEKEEAIVEFKQSNKEAVLVSTVAALSTGFNLDDADTLIFYSVPFSYREVEQSLGRIDRKTSVNDKKFVWMCTDNTQEQEAMQKVYDKVNESMEEWGFGRKPNSKPLKFT